MDHALSLPRAVLLALWLGAQGPVRASDLVAAVQADDEPHRVRAVPSASPADPLHGGADEPFMALLDACAASPRDVAGVVPAPGDLLAVPATVSATAADAGECLLVRTPETCLAAVPVVERFGSDIEPGHLVTWHLSTVPDWRLTVQGAAGSLDDAERALRIGLMDATEALVRLDVARWRPEAAEQIAALRDLQLPVRRLPAGMDGQRVRVLASAARLREIVRLAAQDDGGAVNLWQADQRSTALREIDRVARRAMSAAASTITR